MFPVFIICRDRLSPLIDLTKWLERTGSARIYLVDNASTYAPLLEWYEQTTHTVIRLGVNFDKDVSKLAPWASGSIRKYAPNEFYCVTDPDVIPISDCPPEALQFFHETLLRYPTYKKVGFGLKIDDIPKHYIYRKQFLKWEKQFWKHPIAPGLYEANIDTTFAMYRPNSEHCLSPCIRTDSPYLARHMEWYVDSLHTSEEERYYREHSGPELPPPTISKRVQVQNRLSAARKALSR